MLKFDKKKRKAGDHDVGGVESKSKKAKKALKEGKAKFKKSGKILAFKEKEKKHNSPVEIYHLDLSQEKGDDRDVFPNVLSNVKRQNKFKPKIDEENEVTTKNSNEINMKNVRKDQENMVRTNRKINNKKKRNIDVIVEETPTAIPAIEIPDACEPPETPNIKKNKNRKNEESMDDNFGEMKKKTGKKQKHGEDSMGTKNTNSNSPTSNENNKSIDDNSNTLMKKRKKLNHYDDDDDSAETRDTDSHISPTNRKELVRQKLTEERLKKGLIMLSPKIEAKIYKLKKALKRKGLSAEEIRQIVRKRRRAEELKQRHNDEVCYRCRQPGHRFADCQLVVRDNEQGTGVCFRCGSTEHILRDCTAARAKKGRLPYAKCFVCGLQGHISRECPSNPKGAFPKGGKCNVCGSINHLKKDCPQLTIKDEVSVTARIMRTGLSADALDDE